MDEREKKTISFRYKISANYVVFSITGVHGGLNPRGQIIMNFFHERHPIPRKIIYEFKEDGSLGDEIERDTKTSIIRDVLFGVSILPDTARAIAKWLSEKADECERIMSEEG